MLVLSAPANTALLPEDAAKCTTRSSFELRGVGRLAAECTDATFGVKADEDKARGVEADESVSSMLSLLNVAMLPLLSSLVCLAVEIAVPLKVCGICASFLVRRLVLLMRFASSSSSAHIFSSSSSPRYRASLRSWTSASYRAGSISDL